MAHQRMALLDDHLFYKTPSLRSQGSIRKRLLKKKIMLVVIIIEIDPHLHKEIRSLSKIIALF